MELAGNMEEEEHTMAQKKDNAETDQLEEDNLEGWVDKFEALTREE